MTTGLQLPMLEAEARRVAGEIGSSLPPGVGFTLLLYNYTETADDPNGFTTYISSADRDTMIATMRELLARWDAGDQMEAPVHVHRTKPRRRWRFGK